MKKIITAGLLGGAITASLLGAGAANAVPNEYVGKTPDQLVQIALQRAASLPAGDVQALQAAHKAFVAGDDKKAQSILIDINDSGVWAADPAIEALAQVLPKPIGGTNGDSYTPTPGGTDGKGGPDADGSLMQFRNNQVLAARDNGRKHVVAGEANAAKVRDAIKGALRPKTK
jgi:hypothetical protein